jgi:hypothetical protein
METPVINLIWADDLIDTLLDEFTLESLQEKNIKVLATAHNGHELRDCLQQCHNQVDAVIIDANFHEKQNVPASERITSGLTFARNLYIEQYKKEIPFFLYTGRTDEILRDVYKDYPEVLEDFPRGTKWFHKGPEFDEMLDAIIVEVNNRKTPSFIVRNRYSDVLHAATRIPGAEDYLLDFLVRDTQNTLAEMENPFIKVRGIIEKILEQCRALQLIPPIKSDLNGTAFYLKNKKYNLKEGGNYTDTVLYSMVDEVMPKVLAESLTYVLHVVQDAAHEGSELRLAVNDYFRTTRDVYLLRSIVYLLIDIVLWFSDTAEKHNDPEVNAIIFWKNGE